MLITFEIRWFHLGPLPPKIRSWFEQALAPQTLSTPELRDDYYLTTPGCTNLGLKLRQERLEVKWRQQAAAVMLLSPTCQGQAEQWIKCACPDLDTHCLFPGKPEVWIQVTKMRSQRQFQIRSDAVVEIPVTEHCDRGCTAEITQLTVKETLWWSLALEAFGPPPTLPEDLQQVAQSLLATYPAELHLDHSYAYPYWLSLQP